MGKTVQKAWYDEDGGLFGKDYLEEYAGILTPERTAADIAFLERELRLKPGMKIFDLCCGHGRHTIELAKRGYHMTGQDINGFFIKKAEEAAHEAGATVRWVKGDMRDVPFETEFDVVLNLFTAFGYLENEDQDQKVLHQVAKALKPGGQFLMDIMNRERVMRQFMESEWEELPDQSVIMTKREFDFTKSRMNERRLRVWPGNKRRDLSLSLRMYSLHELIGMCARAGLTFTAAFGDNTSEPFGFLSRRCILLTEKPT